MSNRWTPKFVRWTPADDATLVEVWNRGGLVVEIAEATGRSTDAIRKRVSKHRDRLGLVSAGDRRPPKGAPRLASSGKLGRKPIVWTPAEDGRLVEMWGDLSQREISARLGRSSGTVSRQARRLGLPPVPRGRRQQTHCKRDHPLSGPGSEVRTRGATRTCLKCERLRGRHTRVPGTGAWSPEEEAILVRLWNGGASVREIIEATGRGAGSVRSKIETSRKALGLVPGLGRRRPKHPLEQLAAGGMAWELLVQGTAWELSCDAAGLKCSGVSLAEVCQKALEAVDESSGEGPGETP